MRRRRGVRPAAAAAGKTALGRRIADLQDEIDSLTEDVEDLQEPVEEFELFDQCMYLIGVTEYGGPDRAAGYVSDTAEAPRRRALALDMRGFGRPHVPVPRLPGGGAAEHRVQRGCGRRGLRRLIGRAAAMSDDA